MGYPSQYEAELILQTNEALQNIHTGYASESDQAKMVKQWQELNVIEYQNCFNSDNSPWGIEFKRGKRSIYWRGLKGD